MIPSNLPRSLWGPYWLEYSRLCATGMPSGEAAKHARHRAYLRQQDNGRRISAHKRLLLLYRPDQEVKPPEDRSDLRRALDGLPPGLWSVSRVLASGGTRKHAQRSLGISNNGAVSGLCKQIQARLQGVA